MHFDGNVRLPLEELATLTGLSAAVVRQKMAFWVDAGVVGMEQQDTSQPSSSRSTSEVPIVYFSLDEPRTANLSHGEDEMVVEESEGQNVSSYT